MWFLHLIEGLFWLLQLFMLPFDFAAAYKRHGVLGVAMYLGMILSVIGAVVGVVVLVIWLAPKFAD